MKPCIAVSTSLHFNNYLLNCPVSPVCNGFLETWGLRHELQPGLWSRSAKDSTGHKGNHHTWASNNDNLLKKTKTEKVITTMPPGLTAFAANPVWGGSETMLALISCDPGLHDIQWMWNGCRGAKTGVNFYSNQLAPEDLRRELYPGGFPPIFEPLWMISMADIWLLVRKGFLFIISTNTFIGKSLHRYLRKSIISILPGKYFSSTAT